MTPENQHHSPPHSSGGDLSSHGKKRRRKHRDPLSDKVKHLRRASEKRVRRRQKVERQMLVMAGIIGGLMAILVAVSLIADLTCDWCIAALIAIAMVGLMIWSVFKTIEVLSIRSYRHYRNQQKQRDGTL